MEPADLAIQIVNYKTKGFLNPLIGSIVKDIAGSKHIVEINILDNASGDNLEDLGKKWRNHDVHIYKADNNRGFGAGHNILARKTQARYLLILNPDILFIEDQTIGRLLETLERYKAAVVGPLLLTPINKTKDMSLENLPVEQLKQQPWDHSLTYIGPFHPHDELTEAAWVSGAVFLIDRQQFMRSGGFDERFFLYMEEVDLCRQLRKKRQRIIYNPDIRVLHYSNAVAKKSSRHMLKSLPYFLLKMLKR